MEDATPTTVPGAARLVVERCVQANLGADEYWPLRVFLPAILRAF
jgi:hypothetical protein